MYANSAVTENELIELLNVSRLTVSRRAQVLGMIQKQGLMEWKISLQATKAAEKLPWKVKTLLNYNIGIKK